MAAKKQRKEEKKRKIDELSGVPGADTITEAEATETTTFIEDGTLLKHF